MSSYQAIINHEVDGATWQVEDLEVGVYPLLPNSRPWDVNPATKVKAKRTGFFLVPNFGATAHMLQGSSEDAVVVDCLEAGHASKLADMLAAYVGLTRVKRKEGLLVMQAFSPGLFAHGPPPGPHILMRLLRGEISVDQIDDEFERLQENSKNASAEKNLMKMHWECRACKIAGRADFVKPMADFSVRNEWEFLNHLLPQGAWTRCTRCQRQQRGLAGVAGAEAGAELGGMNERARSSASSPAGRSTCARSARPPSPAPSSGRRIG